MLLLSMHWCWCHKDWCVAVLVWGYSRNVPNNFNFRPSVMFSTGIYGNLTLCHVSMHSGRDTSKTWVSYPGHASCLMRLFPHLSYGLSFSFNPSISITGPGKSCIHLKQTKSSSWSRQRTERTLSVSEKKMARNFDWTNWDLKTQILLSCEKMLVFCALKEILICRWQGTKQQEKSINGARIIEEKEKVSNPRIHSRL